VASNEKRKLSVDFVEDSAHLIEETALNIIPVFSEPLLQLPKLFEDEWIKNKSGELIWKSDPNKSTISSVTGFFGLSFEMFLHIFSPYVQDTGKYGGTLLTKYALPKDIAFNINMLLKSENTKMNLVDGINIFISKN